MNHEMMLVANSSQVWRETTAYFPTLGASPRHLSLGTDPCRFSEDFPAPPNGNQYLTLSS